MRNLRLRVHRAAVVARSERPILPCDRSSEASFLDLGVRRDNGYSARRRSLPRPPHLDNGARLDSAAAVQKSTPPASRAYAQSTHRPRACAEVMTSLRWRLSADMINGCRRALSHLSGLFRT